MSQITIAREMIVEPDVLALFNASDAYHAALYPAENNPLSDVASFQTPNARLFVARSPAGQALGCGVIQLDLSGAEKSAELKLLWVAPEARGLGLGARLLEALEGAAEAAGADVVRLETGIHQPQAIGLYHGHDYHDRGPYGAYPVDPLSVYMEKVLVHTTQPNEVVSGFAYLPMLSATDNEQTGADLVGDVGHLMMPAGRPPHLKVAVRNARRATASARIAIQLKRRVLSGRKLAHTK